MNDIDFEALFKMVTEFPTLGLTKMIMTFCFILLMGVLVYVKYIYDKDKREKAAWKLDQEVRKKQRDIIVRSQNDTARAIIRSLEASEQRQLIYLTEQFKAKDFVSAYLMTDKSFHDKIRSFIYDDGITEDVRAALVVEIIKNG